MNYKVFFGNMTVSQIRESFLMNGFSKEEVEEIEHGLYDPYKEE